MSKSPLFLLALLGACTDPSTTPDDLPIAYVVGAPAEGTVGAAVLEPFDTVPFEGQADGAVYVEASALDDLDAETAGELSEAYVVGQLITVFEVSQPRLDVLVDALSLNAAHKVSFVGEPTGDEREEVYAFARGPNRFEHFSYENGGEPPTSDELVAIRDEFSGWRDGIAADPDFELDPGARGAGPLDVVAQATHYGATQITTTAGGLTVKANPMFVSAWSEDQQSWYVLLKQVYAVDWSGNPNFDFLQATLWLPESGTLTEAPSPGTTTQPVDSQTIGVNTTVPGVVQIGTGAGSLSSSNGALFADQTVTSLVGGQVDNTSNLQDGRMIVEWRWDSPPNGTAANLPAYALWEIPYAGNQDIPDDTGIFQVWMVDNTTTYGQPMPYTLAPRSL